MSSFQTLKVAALILRLGNLNSKRTVHSHFIQEMKARLWVSVKSTSECVCHCPDLLCCLSASRVVVTGWEDEDVLILGYTEEPTRKRRKVTDEGVCLCE